MIRLICLKKKGTVKRRRNENTLYKKRDLVSLVSTFPLLTAVYVKDGTPFSTGRHFPSLCRLCVPLRLRSLFPLGTVTSSGLSRKDPETNRGTDRTFQERITLDLTIVSEFIMFVDEFSVQVL